ncbi:unnamed protein product [Orchesella dallaii]|uniref:Uncharacterized protein n=1 Tax=Orchesella dallaii TaxID=48710 RepID=A0ABP1RQE3_9HEXA
MEISNLENYCVDAHNDPFTFQVIWCGNEKAEVTRKILDWRNNPFMIICNSISVLFLFATLVLLVRRSYKDKIQNWLGLWYVSTVLGAMFPMTIYKLWSMTRFGAPDEFGLRSWTLCMLAAWPAVYFIFLAYFALATLILDLCWRVNPSNRKEGEWFRVAV